MGKKPRQSVFGPFTGEVLIQVIQKDRESRAKDEIIERQRDLIKELMGKKSQPVKRDYGELLPYLHRNSLRYLKIVDKYPGLTYRAYKDAKGYQELYRDKYHHSATVGNRMRDLKKAGYVEIVYDPTIKRNRVYPKEASK